MASPPSGDLAVAGATLLANLSASPETLGKCAYRRALVEAQSARCLAAYLYASAGPGESSTDLVFSGHSLVAEYGQVLAETERFRFDTQSWRSPTSIWNGWPASACARAVSPPAGRSATTGRCRSPWATRGRRTCSARCRARRSSRSRSRSAHARCREIFAIQTTGLMTRLRHTGSQPGGDRHLRRPRFDPGPAGDGQGLRPARPAAHRHRGGDHARFRHHRPHPRQCRDPGRGTGRHPADASPSMPRSASISRISATTRRSTTSPTKTPRPASAPRS